MADITDIAEEASVAESLVVSAVDLPTSMQDSKKKKNKKKNKKGNPTTTKSVSGVALGANWGVDALLTARGRVLIAARALPKGFLVFAERAICVVTNSKADLCCICGKMAGDGEALTSKRCQTQSRWDIYCSVQCQESSIAGKYLELESVLYDNNGIDAIATKHNCDGDLIKMISKLACYKYLHQSEDESNLMIDHGSYIATTYQGMESLVSHLDKQSTEWVSSITHAMTDLLDEYMNPAVKDTLTVSYLVELAAKVNTNSYGIVNPVDEGTSKTIGFGLFPAVGLVINHSCYPNLYFTYNPTHGLMEYRTLVDVPAGLELTVSYINPLQTLEQRQELITSSRYFKCECPRCTVHTQLYAYISQHGYRNLMNNIQDAFTSAIMDGVTTKSSASTLSSIVSSIHTNNLPLPLLIGDIMLDGIHCKHCDDSKGTVILNHTNATFGCIICGRSNTTTAEYTELSRSVDLIKSRWKHCNSFEDLSKFLDDVDPLAAANSTSSLKSQRATKLHANNLCIIETHQILADYYLFTGTPDTALPYYNRYLASVKDILPANHPLISSMTCHMIKSLPEISKKSSGNSKGMPETSKKSSGNSKERNALYKQVVESRSIALGREHVLTTQIAAKLSL